MLKKLAKLLLSPNGRIRRNQFWMSLLLLLFVGWEARDNSFFWTAIYAYLSITIFGKRLHDLGHTAWKICWPAVLHIALIVLSIRAASQALGAEFVDEMGGLRHPGPSAAYLTTLAVLPGVLWLGFSLLVGLPQGQTGDNRYGTDPRVEEKLAASPGQAA